MHTKIHVEKRIHTHIHINDPFTKLFFLFQLPGVYGVRGPRAATHVVMEQEQEPEIALEVVYAKGMRLTWKPAMIKVVVSTLYLHHSLSF